MSDSDSDSESTSSSSSSNSSSSSSSSSNSSVPIKTEPDFAHLNIPEHQRPGAIPVNTKNTKVKSTVSGPDLGPPLSTESINYFRQITETITAHKLNSTAVLDSDELSLLITAVLSEINTNNVYRLLVNKHTALCIELLIEYSTIEQLIIIINLINNTNSSTANTANTANTDNTAIVKQQNLFYLLSIDRQASHCLEKIIEKIIIYNNNTNNTNTDSTNNDSTDSASINELNQLFLNCLVILSKPPIEYDNNNNKYRSGWLELINNDFGSHLIRNLIKLLINNISTGNNHSNNNTDSYYNILITITTELLSLFDEFIIEFQFNTVSSATIQALLLGLKSINNNTNNSNNNNSNINILIKKLIFKLLLLDIDTAIDIADNIDSINPKSASHFIQLIYDRSGSHLLESIIQSIGPADNDSDTNTNIDNNNQLLEFLFNNYIKSHLIEYSTHSISNYLIQKFLYYSYQSNIILNSILLELTAEQLKILLFQSNKGGIVWKLIESTAKNYIYKQKHSNNNSNNGNSNNNTDSTNSTSTNLHSNIKPKRIYSLIGEIVDIKDLSKDFTLLSKLLYSNNSTNNSSNSTNQSKCNYFGSLIIQSLLKFPTNKHSDTDYINLSILNSTINELIELACDSIGSRILDSYLDRPTLLLDSNSNKANKAKYLLFDKLFINNSNNNSSQSIIQLLTNRYSSFVVEKLFTIIDINRKIQLIELLLQYESQLLSSASKSGKVLLFKFNTRLYKKQPETWKAQFNINQLSQQQSQSQSLSKTTNTTNNNSNNNNNKRKSESTTSTATSTVTAVKTESKSNSQSTDNNKSKRSKLKNEK